MVYLDKFSDCLFKAKIKLSLYLDSYLKVIRNLLTLSFVVNEETREIIILSFYSEDATMKQDIKQSLPYGTAPGIEC